MLVPDRILVILVYHGIYSNLLGILLRYMHRNFYILVLWGILSIYRLMLRYSDYLYGFGMGFDPQNPFGVLRLVQIVCGVYLDFVLLILVLDFYLAWHIPRTLVFLKWVMGTNLYFPDLACLLGLVGSGVLRRLLVVSDCEGQPACCLTACNLILSSLSLFAVSRNICWSSSSSPSLCLLLASVLVLEICPV